MSSELVKGYSDFLFVQQFGEDGGEFPDALFEFLLRSCVCLQRVFTVLVDLERAAHRARVQDGDHLHYLFAEVDADEAVVVLPVHVDGYLAVLSGLRHSKHSTQRHDPFDSVGQKRKGRGDVEQISIANGQYPLLFFADFIDLDDDGREINQFWVRNAYTMAAVTSKCSHF